MLAHVRCLGRSVGFFGWSENVSEGGMLLSSDHRLELGEELELDFFLPVSKERITVLGAVVRREMDDGDRGWVYGVQFVRFEHGEATALREFVDHRRE